MTSPSGSGTAASSVVAASKTIVPTDGPRTLPDVLRHAARHYPERGVAIFDGRGRHHERRTYPEMLAAVEQAAGRWAALGVEPGERVLVCLTSSWEWMEAWFGAALLGALPVAIAPPGAMGSSEGFVQRLDDVRTRLGARYLVSTDALRKDAERLGIPQIAEAVLTPEELKALTPERVVAPRPAEEDLAFLQLTSGSTGHSRAVQISHRSLLHNCWSIDHVIGKPHGKLASAMADCMVSWLPLHHDMGLVGCLFQCLTRGLDLWLLRPESFLARPLVWLQNLGAHGASFAPAPNFGYQLCDERLTADKLDGIDLSPWFAAMTGAEMVRAETNAAFSELTARCGFRPEAFRPCFGLAEGTLCVTMDTRGLGTRTVPLPAGGDSGMGLTDIVCVGEPIPDTEVRIVAPDGSTLPDGQIGEVRSLGPSNFSGYYNDPEATAEGLKDGWLCTGDLGFLKDGELYIAGRLKDLLIVRGHNLMPHELEWLAESVTGGGGALRCGAFSVAQGAEGEQAVLVVETTEKEPDALAALDHDIRQRVGRALGMTLADVAFVRRGRIPKTTSGKVQRRELRRRYLDGKVERLGS